MKKKSSMEGTEKREYLKSLLELRINQQKMLNNTLCEMMFRNSSRESIEAMKEDLNDVMNEINIINTEISKLGEDEEVNYVYYGDSIGEKAKKEAQKSEGFYDSIIKKNKIAQFKMAEDIKKDAESHNKYNYKSVYDEIKKNCPTKDFLEDLRNTADSRLLSNRFLVDLKDSLGIPEIMVKSVSFDTIEKMVSLCIYDFISDKDGGKFPIMEVLKYYTAEFDFNIKHLDSNGNVLYTEYYSKCRIGDVYRDPIDYSSDDFSKIQIFITYQNVEYETSN